MTNKDFDLDAALETLRRTDRAALDNLLLESAGLRNFAAVEVLLKAGAALDAQDNTSRTALHYAARGQTETVEQLMAKGAATDAKGGDGWIPLHLVARNGHTATAAEPIAKGAAIEAEDEFGHTPLRLAADKGHAALARQLRQARNPPPIVPIRAALKALQND